MNTPKHEALNGVCNYIFGGMGLMTECLDFTQWWHFAIGLLSTVLILMQAAHDIPINIKKFTRWIKSHK